jgi:hypothetical protein
VVFFATGFMIAEKCDDIVKLICCSDDVLRHNKKTSIAWMLVSRLSDTPLYTADVSGSGHHPFVGGGLFGAHAAQRPFNMMLIHTFPPDHIAVAADLGTTAEYPPGQCKLQPGKRILLGLHGTPL